MRKKVKISDLKAGNQVFWIEDGWNECEGIYVGDDMIKGRSITFDSPSRYMMVNRDVQYYIKESHKNVILES